jgi:hypothetical protein
LAPNSNKSTSNDSEAQNNDRALDTKPNDVSHVEQPNALQTSAVVNLAATGEATMRDSEIAEVTRDAYVYMHAIKDAD